MSGTRKYGIYIYCFQLETRSEKVIKYYFKVHIYLLKYSTNAWIVSIEFFTVITLLF